jgi:hypothetical protein
MPAENISAAATAAAEEKDEIAQWRNAETGKEKREKNHNKKILLSSYM